MTFTFRIFNYVFNFSFGKCFKVPIARVVSESLTPAKAQE